MIQFDDLRDSEWALIEGLFCHEAVAPDRSGRRRVEPRAVVNAVLWALQTGHGWSRVPGWYPSRPASWRFVLRKGPARRHRMLDPLIEFLQAEAAVPATPPVLST
jgi:transposase